MTSQFYVTSLCQQNLNNDIKHLCRSNWYNSLIMGCIAIAALSHTFLFVRFDKWFTIFSDTWIPFSIFRFLYVYICAFDIVTKVMNVFFYHPYQPLTMLLSKLFRVKPSWCEVSIIYQLILFSWTWQPCALSVFLYFAKINF